MGWEVFVGVRVSSLGGFSVARGEKSGLFIFFLEHEGLGESLRRDLKVKIPIIYFRQHPGSTTSIFGTRRIEFRVGLQWNGR